MSLGSMSEKQFAEKIGDAQHDAGCAFGGFSCGYWLRVIGCPEEHWEKHIVGADGACPCGHTFPGASSVTVYSEADAVSGQEEPNG